MINSLTFGEITHSILPCIINSIITLFIMYKFMKAFLGYTPEHKKTSVILYALFFVFQGILNFSSEVYILSIVPYSLNKYINFALYLILFIIVMAIAFCYNPTLSTGLSSGCMTALFLCVSIPIADYVFDIVYRFVVPNFEVFNSAASFRHVFYVVFEEYQQIFIYVLEIIIKLLFLFAVLRVKKIYDERNIYYVQASRQETNNLELKQFRHDIKNHIVALNQMLASNDADKAMAYLATINEMTNTTQLFSHTGNVALDSIVNYKLSKAERNGIKCTFSASIPEHLGVRDEDIIIILGNLLDNAIEACVKLETDRYIKINLSYQRGLLSISIINSFNGVVKKSGKKLATLKTDKSSHGLGLSNVQKALSHYNGTFENTANQNIFKLYAIMYVNRK